MLLALERDLEVVGQAQDGAEALDLYREHRPDVVFLDIWLPDKDGLEALQAKIRCDVHVLDIRDRDAVHHLFGNRRIDVLINNAGISMRALFEEVDLQVIDVDFRATQSGG